MTNRYRENYLSVARRQRRKRNLMGLGFIALIVIGLVALLGYQFAYSASEGHQICQVQEKDRSTDKSGDSIYRVYTSCGVFTVADDPIRGRWNSADTYAGLVKGASYEFHTIGWRNGFLSIFPNILDAKQAGHE